MTMTLEQALRAAEESLCAGLSTPDEVADALLKAGIKGAEPESNNWAHDCPLTHWFSRFLLAQEVITAGQAVAYNGWAIRIYSEDGKRVTAQRTLRLLLAGFADDYDDRRYPQLIRP